MHKSRLAQLLYEVDRDLLVDWLERDGWDSGTAQQLAAACRDSLYVLGYYEKEQR